MAHDERESPRAAIIEWLNNNHAQEQLSRTPLDSYKKASKHHLKRHGPERHSVADTHLPRKTASNCVRCRRNRPEENYTANSPSTDSAALGVGSARYTKLYSRDRPRGVPLDLQAQFSKSTHYSAVQNDSGNVHRHRKRCRSLSSPSVPLQPAKMKDLTGLASDPISDNKCRKKQSSDVKRAEDNSYSLFLTESPRIAVESAKPTRSYERRPRRKTREDHYELKQDKKAKKYPMSRNGPRRDVKKRRRKEKTGAALMHDFTAQNVSNNRLTVRYHRNPQYRSPD